MSRFIATKKGLDPNEILASLKCHLDDHGALLDESVPQFVSFMQDLDGALVPRCLTLYILRATSTEVQRKVCDNGAWHIFLKWLQDSLQEENFAFLYELLNLYNVLPITMTHLTMNVTPKLINTISKKCIHEDCKELATLIVRRWKSFISSEPASQVSSTLSKKRKAPDSIKEVATSELNDTQSNILLNGSKDAKKRKSTVKMPAFQMRSAGLEEIAMLQPKSRADVVKSTMKTESVLKDSLESLHQKITVNPPEIKKPPPELHESSDFIKSLTTPSAPFLRKKRKLPRPDTKSGTQSPPKEQAPGTNSELVNLESPNTTEGMGLKKSSLSDFASSFTEKKIKKSVTWPEDDENLVEVKYFEIEEGERSELIVNVNRLSVDAIRMRETALERQLFHRCSDFELEGMKWYPPQEVESQQSAEPGCKSEERHVQTEREKRVLQIIYFTKENVPASATEPENQNVEATTPKVIPLEEISEGPNAGPDNNHNSNLIEDSSGGQISLKQDVFDLIKSYTSVPAADTVSNKQTPTQESVHEKNKFLKSNQYEYDEPTNFRAGFNSDEIPGTRIEIMKILQERYPDINVDECSEEKIRELLDPLRDELIKRGILRRPMMPPKPEPYFFNGGYAPPYAQMRGPPNHMNFPRYPPPPFMGRPPLGRPPYPYPGMNRGPPLKPPSRPRFLSESSKKIRCKFHLSNQGCHKGKDCKFLH